MAMKREKSKSFGTAILIVSALVVLVLSPLALVGLTRVPVDWEELSFIGQSYGAAATLLSGAALVGIVVTSRQQARQLRITAEQAIRQLHYEIIREARNDPSLMKALENIPDDRLDITRQAYFLNSYFMFLRMGWISGQVALSEIEDLAAYTISTPTGAYWWSGQNHLRNHFESDYVGALERGAQRAEKSRELPEADRLTSLAGARNLDQEKSADISPDGRSKGVDTVRAGAGFMVIGASAVLGWLIRSRYERRNGTGSR